MAIFSFSITNVASPVTIAIQSTILQGKKFMRTKYRQLLFFLLTKYSKIIYLLSKTAIGRPILKLLGLVCTSINKVVYWSGLYHFVKVLSRHFKLLLMLLATETVWRTCIVKYYYRVMGTVYRILYPKYQAERYKLVKNTKNSQNFVEFSLNARALDAFDGLDEYRYTNKSKHYDYERLEQFCSILLNLYLTRNVSAVMVLLSSHLTRNFANILNPQLYTVLTIGTKQLIEDYVQLVTQCLELVFTDTTIDLNTKIQFFSRLRHLYGTSALTLSGGASFCVFHAGVIHELVASRLIPRIISGSSAGSIFAGIVATRTDDEILLELKHPENIFLKFYYPEPLAPDEYARFGPFPRFPDYEPNPFSGRLERKEDSQRQKTMFDVRFLFHAILKAMRHPTMTFLDAFYYSGGKVLNISVHNPSLEGGLKICNYLTTPHVYVASAVVASCSLPLVFEPSFLIYSTTYVKLLVKYLKTSVEKKISSGKENNSNAQASQTTINPHNFKTFDKNDDFQHELEAVTQTGNELITGRSSNHLNSVNSTTPLNYSSINPLPYIPDDVEYHAGIPYSRKIYRDEFLKNNWQLLNPAISAAVGNLIGDTREYSDGSLGKDIPTQQLKELWNVNFSITSQINPHIAPFLVLFPSLTNNFHNWKVRPYSFHLVSKMQNMFLALIQYLLSSFRSVVMNLYDTMSFVRHIFPSSLYGMMSQSWVGDVTIMPVDLNFGIYQTAILNPEQMGVIKAANFSKRVAWQYISRIKVACKIEHYLHAKFTQLKEMQHQQANLNQTEIVTLQRVLSTTMVGSYSQNNQKKQLLPPLRSDATSSSNLNSFFGLPAQLNSLPTTTPSTTFNRSPPLHIASHTPYAPSHHDECNFNINPNEQSGYYDPDTWLYEISQGEDEPVPEKSSPLIGITGGEEPTIDTNTLNHYPPTTVLQNSKSAMHHNVMDTSSVFHVGDLAGSASSSNYTTLTTNTSAITPHRPHGFYRIRSSFGLIQQDEDNDDFDNYLVEPHNNNHQQSLQGNTPYNHLQSHSQPPTSTKTSFPCRMSTDVCLPIAGMMNNNASISNLTHKGMPSLANNNSFHSVGSHVPLIEQGQAVQMRDTPNLKPPLSLNPDILNPITPSTSGLYYQAEDQNYFDDI